MFTEDQGTGLIHNLKTLFAAPKKQEEETPIEEYIEEYVRPSLVGSSVSSTVPMSTRTVMFEAKQETLITKEEEEQPIENLDILFAEKFIAQNGMFVYCETMAEAVAQIKELAAANNWAHVYFWENEVKDMFHNNDFQKGAIGFTMEKSDAVTCLCESLIVENGTLLLNPQQASRRRLPVFPKTQIFIANSKKVCFSLTSALKRYNSTHKDELPSILNLSDNNKGNFYHDGQLVMKSEGTADIYLILIDEQIPVSTRV